MADSKQIIELEVKQVQEQLIKLIQERKNLQEEFEQLTGSSHQLLQEIQEDPTSASERKLHKYEAEKRRIEEKLEVLESEISEKAKRITLLDSKAGLFLQQVSTPPLSNNLSNIDGQAEVDVAGDEGIGSAVTVGAGGRCDEGARDGARQVVVKCSQGMDLEVSQAAGEGRQATHGQQHEVQECDHADTLDANKVESGNVRPEVNGVTSPEIEVTSPEIEVTSPEIAGHLVHEDTILAAAAEGTPGHKDAGAGETTGTAESEPTGGEEKCEGQENLIMTNVRSELKSVVSVDDKQSCLGDTVVEDEKAKGPATPEPLENGVSDQEKELNESEVPSHTQVGETLGDSQEAQPTTGNEAQAVDVPEGASGAQTGQEGTHAGVEVTSAGKQSSDSSTPVGEGVGDQVTSLSVLVAELRRVKDDMGKCMTVKEHSFVDLEDQLQAANREVSSLKASMALLSKDLQDKKQSYRALEEENKKKKMDIELKLGEVQEVANKCTMLSEEKVDLLRKMEVLEIMMTEYRTEIEMLVGEKNQMEQQTKQLLAARTATSTAEAEIDSRTSVEDKEREIEELVEKIQSMEKEMKDLNDKLKVTNRHLKVMAREREYKQRECEILKHKVEMVELKMCELQGTFDMLMKAVMVERDDLIKEMDVKNGQIDDLEQTVVRLKETHEQELENVLYEKRLSDEEIVRYKSGELRTPGMLEKELETAKQNECLEKKLREKTTEAESLEKKVKTVHDDMTDFVNSLKDEMSRYRDDSHKLLQEKTNLAETFSSLQEEHKELQRKHQNSEKSFEELEKVSQEKSVTMGSLKIQLEDVQKQLENVTAKTLSVSSEMLKKAEESREELCAREATIQELTVTLTNNQKQSMENYNALQQDMNSLQAKLKTSLEEHKKQQKELEERLKLSEKEKVKELNALQEETKSLKAELSGKNEKLQTAKQRKPAKGTEAQMEKDKEIEALNKKVEELTKSLASSQEATQGKEAKSSQEASQGKEAKSSQEASQGKEAKSSQEASQGKEAKTAADTDGVHLHQQIKDLTAELATHKRNESGSEASKNQEDFEASIDTKEKKIQLLESKVSDLEMCLANKSGYITQLEDRLKDSPQIPNSAEAHLAQINQLSADISKFKEELKQTYEECKALKNTVSQLENDKKSIEDEKAKIVEEYESKLRLSNGGAEQAEALLEQKKNSVERLELELRSSSVFRIDMSEAQPEMTQKPGTQATHSAGSWKADHLDDVHTDALQAETHSGPTQLKVFQKDLFGGVQGHAYDEKKAILDYEDQISSLIANHHEQMSSLNTKYEAKRVEEKAEFGRVLVAKIDHYDKQVVSQDEEINGLKTDIAKLQMEIYDKVKIIEELEGSLDDMALTSAALRGQVDDLKVAITRASTSTSTSQSCLDFLHAEYETRMQHIQEHYEARLNALQSCLPGTDVELQAVACASPSEESEYSIELSCLRPFLQGTADQATAILSAMGAVPKPPCPASTKLKPSLCLQSEAGSHKGAPPEPGSSTITALSSTTHPSRLDPNTTAHDKYRIKLELSACCIEKLQDFEACLDEARAQVSEATAKRLRLEESLTENLGAGATLTAQIDQLRRHNQDLQDTVQCHHREKEETDKRLAALELSNERSKNQVAC
ncbi:hypothetical protein GWK47_027428 [Chionoecetes opilio]|uniref:Uncharacterized protein n=1 Tax=Chionoecetes opilio TaxID=41210 RepID=A0A8J8WLH5_CHIOP|nr:hypothetical protein GWK47_027428 [Chionoecetes opilio]